MVKKLFALASVSALAGLVSTAGVAGCTTTTTEAGPTADSGTTDAKPKADAKPQVETDTGTDPDPAKTCLTTKDVDATKIEYAKAVVTKNACTKEESTKLSDFLKAKIDAKDFGFKNSEWAAEVSEGCGKCVFTDVEAEAWGVVIGKEDEFFTYNRGGCIEVVSGDEDCGRAYQQFQNCALVACQAECKTQDEFDACLDDTDAIYTGPCADSIKNVNTACGKNVGAYETACKGGLDTMIKYQCIQGGAKAGDAGDGG